MANTFECLTIKANTVSDVLRDRGSKFIGYLYQVNTEEEVSDKLTTLRSEYPDATHHCYAYRLGFKGEKFRANDDGEPGGSAGLPILNQLKSADLTFVLCIVVRYYGGTKLGVGGLIQAYKGATILAIEKAKKVTYYKKTTLKIVFPYHNDNEVKRGLNEFDAEILNQSFEMMCTFTVQIKDEHLNDFSQFFEPYHEVKVKKIS